MKHVKFQAIAFILCCIIIAFTTTQPPTDMSSVAKKVKNKMVSHFWSYLLPRDGMQQLLIR